MVILKDLMEIITPSIDSTSEIELMIWRPEITMRDSGNVKELETVPSDIKNIFKYGNFKVVEYSVSTTTDGKYTHNIFIEEPKVVVNYA